MFQRKKKSDDRKLWWKENIEDLKAIKNLNLKLINNRRIPDPGIPDNPQPTQGAYVPVSGLTGFVCIFFSIMISFVNHSLFHKNPSRIPP